MHWQAQYSCFELKSNCSHLNCNIWILWTYPSCKKSAFLLSYSWGSSWPSPGDLPNLGIKTESPALQALLTEPPGKQQHSGIKQHSLTAPKFFVLCLVILPLALTLVCSATQSGPALCDPINCNPPGSSVHGILQARILEWLLCLSLGGLPDPGIESRSPALQVDSLPVELPGKPWPWPLETTNFTFFCYNIFTFSRLPYNWNHTIWKLSD